LLVQDSRKSLRSTQRHFSKTLVDKGQLEELVFGFFLAESNSEFIGGGRDSGRFSGDLTYVNVNITVRIFEVSLAFLLTRTRCRVFGRPSLMLFQLTEIMRGHWLFLAVFSPISL
jgi:hypothetical protein